MKFLLFLYFVKVSLCFKISKFTKINKGCNVALVTPMHENGNIDYKSFYNLIKWQIKEQTKGIVILGSTGESNTLNQTEKNVLTYNAKKITENKVPLIVGTGGCNIDETIKNTIDAITFGADACMIVTPYYSKPPQKALIKYYKTICNKVKDYCKIYDRESFPIILYNVPSRTGINLEIDTIREIAKDDCIIGIKDCSDDINRLYNLKTIDDFMVYCGEDSQSCLWINNDADGVISVTANIIPRFMNRMIEESFRKSIYSYKLNNLISNINKDLFIETNPIPVKWCLKNMNKIDSDFLRLPLERLNKKYHKKLENSLNYLNKVNKL